MLGLMEVWLSECERTALFDPLEMVFIILI